MPTSHLPDLIFSDFFSGIGLMRLGLEQAGWQSVFSNDRAPEKFEMFASFFNDAHTSYRVCDISSLKASDIPRSLLATASFPCTDLSLAGRLQGLSGKESSAFWEFIRLLRHQNNQPQIVMLENVPGWLSSRRGQDFRIAIKALNDLGYCCDVFKIDAAHFVPQSRSRIFVIGQKIDQKKQCFNVDLSRFQLRDVSLKSKTLEKAVFDNLDLNWNFQSVPMLPTRSPANLGDIVEDIHDSDDRWWSQPDVDRHLSMMSPLNIDFIRQLQTGFSITYCAMYRRIRAGQQRAELRKDGLAGCLRTAKGGSSRQMLVRVHAEEIRMRLMTPREYARLQGVPDNYPIPVRVNQALTGFGDAVCVPAITWIAKNILEPLIVEIHQISSRPPVIASKH